jgi:LacI family transcriptional regulator
MGYTLSICVSNESCPMERDFVHKLLSNRVEGVFISIAQETYDLGYYEHLESIIQRSIPLIFIDREFEGFAASRATVNDYLGAFAAVEHLIAMGCRRIAHLRGPEGLTVSEQRLAGYMDCLRKYNLPIDQDLIQYTNFKVESAIIPTQRLIELPERPDAIFAANDQAAIGAMRVILDRHLRIPNDIAVVGFDNSPVSAYTYPSLTSVARPGVGIGMEASRMFRSQVMGQSVNSVESIVLPTELIIRESSLRSV